MAAVDVSTLAGLPIGEGQARTRWRPLEDAAGGGVDEPGGPTVSPAFAPFESQPEAPSVELVVWDERRLRQPLRLVGKTVNWQVRRRTGLPDTEAGLMSEENLREIGEPLAEVFNRYEPTRALAARSVELNLVLALYDYAHETVHVAARDKLAAEKAERLARGSEQKALAHLAPIPYEDEGVPEL